jgi:digeranylgeranylglycerophospholipid reductase
VLLDEDRAHDQDPSARFAFDGMSRDVVDVVCVGLGPAGSRAAAAAAKRGCRVIGFDRRREPGRPVQCAEFVPALIGIEVAGLSRSVRQRIRAMATFVEDDAPDINEPFPGQMLDRAHFDAALVEEAEQAGATCRFGVSVRDVGRDGRINLSNGDSIAPRVIIGADGPRSLAGRAIGEVNVSLVETRQITVPLCEPYETTDIFLSGAIPGGYGWLFPKGDLANLGAGVAPAHKGRLKAIVEKLHESLRNRGRVGAELLGMTGGAIPVGGMRKPWGMLGGTLVLLAGDSAGLANPVTGAGIAAAVQSGALAGNAAAAAVAGDGTAGRDYHDDLEMLFGAALARGVRRRRELMSATKAGVPLDKATLRRGWIAYPQYWAA